MFWQGGLADIEGIDEVHTRSLHLDDDLVRLRFRRVHLGYGDLVKVLTTLSPSRRSDRAKN